MKKIRKISYRIIVLAINFCLIFEQIGFAQIAPQLGIPAYLSGQISADKFRPMQLRSLSYDSLKNNFSLYLDKGDIKELAQAQIRENTQKLMEYFRVGIVLPNSKFWVNLRPDKADEVIDLDLEKTDLGRVLLEADLQLKKDVANFSSPNTPEGRQYWDKLYEKAQSLFGQQEVTVPTLTRPWIVPGEVVIRKTRDSAYIYKATLKVMLEQDYLKDSPEYKFDDPRLKELNNYSSQLMRELVIPKLTREVNSSKRYASLRQVYYSLTLAQWFKQSFKGQQGEYARFIDGMDLTGLASKTPWTKNTYFNAYQKSFAKGEYDQQETRSSPYGMTIRRYFSGGILPLVDAKTVKVEFEGTGALPQAGAGLLKIELPANDLDAAKTVAVPVSKEDLSAKKDGGKVDIAKWVDKEVKADNLNVDMFRDYDYRSQLDTTDPNITQKLVTSELMFRFGIVWAKMALKKAADAGIDLKIPENRVVLVARDARKVEEDLPEAIIDAFRYMGLDVKYTGENPSAVTSYSWAVQQFRPLMSVFITASHVDAEKKIQVRGFKVAMVNTKGGTVQSMTTQEIKEVSRLELTQLLKLNGNQLNKYLQNSRLQFGLTREGNRENVNVDKNCVRMNSAIGRLAAAGASLSKYAAVIGNKGKDVLEVLSGVEDDFGPSVKPLTGLKLVIEAAHTPSGKIAGDTFRALGAEVEVLNEDVVLVEGHHQADPAKNQNLNGLRTRMSDTKADFGLAFDLDGDRGAIVVPMAGGFETLTPDNLIVALLENLTTKWGYIPSNNKIAVIRDVLGTYAVNDKTKQLSGDDLDRVITEQTDAGYVFLKERRQQLINDYVVPIYGERSGHCWLDVSGEVENPVALAVLFSVMAAEFKAAHKDEEYIFKAVYDLNRIPYYQAPRFSAKFSDKFLQRLVKDGKRNINKAGQKIWGAYNAGRPPQEFIALARTTVIEALRDEFKLGKVFDSPAGKLVVSKLDTFQDKVDQRFRFADIHFSLPDGTFAGRYVFRASSNDPLYVMTYESPVFDGEGDSLVAEQRAMSVGGLVMDWLEKNDFAILSRGLLASADIEKWDLEIPLKHLETFQAKNFTFSNNWNAMRAIAKAGFGSLTHIYQAVFDNAQALAFGNYFQGYKWPGQSGFDSKTTIVPDLKGNKVIGNGLGVLSVFRQYSQNLVEGLKLAPGQAYKLEKLLASKDAESFLHNIIITSGGQAQRNAKYSQIGKCLAKIPMSDKDRREARYILDGLLDIGINIEKNFKADEFMFAIIYGDALISFDPEKIAQTLADPQTRKGLACLLLQLDYTTAPDYGFAKLSINGNQVEMFQEKYNKIKRDDKGQISEKVEEVDAIRRLGSDDQRMLLDELFKTKNIDILKQIFSTEESRNELMKQWLQDKGYLTPDNKIYMNPAFSVMGIEAFLRSAYLAGITDEQGMIQVDTNGKVKFQETSYLSETLASEKTDKVNIDYYGNIVPSFASQAADNSISKAVNAKGTLYAVPFEGTWYDTGNIGGEREINVRASSTLDVWSTYGLEPEVNSRLTIAGKKVGNFGTDSWVEAENGKADPKSVQSDSYVKAKNLVLGENAQLYNVLFKNIPYLEVGANYVLTLSTLIRDGKAYIVPVIWDERDDMKKGYFGGRTDPKKADSAVLISEWAKSNKLAADKIIDKYAEKEQKVNEKPEQDRKLAWRDSVDLYSAKLFPIISLDTFNKWNEGQDITGLENAEVLKDLPKILNFLQHKKGVDLPESYSDAVVNDLVSSRSETYNNQDPQALSALRQDISTSVEKAFDGGKAAEDKNRNNEKKVGDDNPGVASDALAPGGVDFRAIPVGGQMINPLPLTPRVMEMANSASIQDLNEEWRDIQGRTLIGPVPYDKLKEYVAACCQRQDTARQIEEIQSWVNNVLSLEEAAAVATSQELKEVLLALG